MILLSFLRRELSTPVKECSWLRADQFRSQDLVLGMSTVVKDHGGPVLARIASLQGSIHFVCCGGRVVMVNTHDCVVRVDQLRQLPDVCGIQKITIHEHRPSLEPRQKRCQKPGEREFGALCSILSTGVQSRFPQVLHLDGNDLHCHGGSLKDRVPANLVSQLLSRIEAHEDS